MGSEDKIPFPLRCLYISVIVLGLEAGLVTGRRDHDFAVMDQIERINKNTDPNSEDVAIIESDIRLPPAESAAASGEFSNALRFRSRIWPGGVVPYVLDDSIVNRTSHLEALRKGMETWENNTCVKFVKRTNELRYARIFYGSKGCNSNIGALWTRPSQLSLGLRCNLGSIATHELGHLLGFAHEQNRPDRDQYINILWENVDPAHHKIFIKQNHWIFHTFGTPYDYNSIMHYGRYHFSKNGEPTMVSRDPKIKWFGSRYPSKLDIKEMNLLYSCPEFPVFPHHFSIRTTSPPFLHCIAINQPRDRDWGSKYLCYKPALKKLNITWSPKGKVIGQDCLNTAMPYEPSARLWANSFLCISRDSLLKLSWSLSGPLNGQECLLVREPTRGYGKGYFLCARTKYKKIDGGWSKWSLWRPCTQQCGGGFRIRVRSCDSPAPKYGGAQCRGSYYETSSCNTHRCPEFPSWPYDFKFMFINFFPKRKQCISIYERAQYADWARAKLCWPNTKRFVDIRWSDRGRLPGMRCTRITERSGRYQSSGWYNNYLCVKPGVPYVFRWSTNGPIKGFECLRWQNNAFARRNLWQNNYLCAREYPRPTRSSSTGCYPRWRSFFVNRVPYCYFPISKKYLTWKEAEDFCREKKSHLASINSKEEQSFIRTITSSSVWIGLRKKQEWEWSDGSRITYLNWSRGEPNNGGTSGVAEECAMHNSMSRQWNDYPCNTKFNFVCKMRGAL